MKPIMFIGIVLIVLGVVALAYQGVTYTSREKIIDIGPIQATHETKKTIPLSPLLGGIAFEAISQPQGDLRQPRDVGRGPCRAHAASVLGDFGVDLQTIRTPLDRSLRCGDWSELGHYRVSHGRAWL